MSENPMTNEIDGNYRGNSTSIRRRQSELVFPNIEVEGSVAQAAVVNRIFGSGNPDAVRRWLSPLFQVLIEPAEYALVVIPGILKRPLSQMMAFTFIFAHFHSFAESPETEECLSCTC